MKAFLNCPGCGTSGWVIVNDQQEAECKLCGFSCTLDNPNIGATSA